MSYKRLFLLVEGNDDQRFFERIIKPKLLKRYSDIKIVKYSEWKKKKIKAFLKALSSMKADYLYIMDINDHPCVTARKEKLINRIPGVDQNKLIVVIKEIESWYLAGIAPNNLKKLKIKQTKNTNTLTKERFNNLIPGKFDSRIDFMIEILNLFSFDTAKRKNDSFLYFTRKFNL